MAVEQIGVGDMVFNQEARDYINQVMDSGRLSYGPFTKKLESEFARMHEVKYAAFCNSGTSALQASIHALKIKHGYESQDEVIVPALTFVATVNTVIQNDLKPVFVDVEPDYFCMDIDPIPEAITERTRMILPVHVGGQSADMKYIMRMANRNGLQVVEDSCEAVLARYHDQSVGSFGDISCFSTYVAHILTTGVGGFACTSDPELAVLVRSLFNHGRDNIYISIDDDKDKDNLPEVIAKRFKFDHIGYSYRATEMEGALGLAQLPTLYSNVVRRREIATQLNQGLGDLSDVLQTPKTRPNSSHSFMFYPLVCRPDVERESLVNYLEQHGVETRQLLPLINQPVYKDLVRGQDFPVAQMLNEKAFYVGCYPTLTDKKIDHMLEVFHGYFK